MQPLMRRTLPPIPKGYPLPPFFSVVVPIARTNLITNPSFETNTTNWTAFGAGSIARSAAQQYHGAYSLAVTPTAAATDGAFYGTVSLVSGTLYAASAKVLGVAGVSYQIAFYTTGGVKLSGATFVATGRWQWVWAYYAETSSTTRNIVIGKASGTSTGVFYIDGVQVEAINAGEFVSTYIDGDQQGLVPNQFPAAYLWGGTPHASTSSRSGQTRAGGMVMRLDYYGFLLLTMIGLALPPVNNVSVPYVQLDGAQYERTQKPPRQFTLGGRWDAAAFPQLQRQISDLGSVLDRDLIGQQQPLTLLYQGLNDCGSPLTGIARIVCSYQGGLEGITDNLHAEQSSIVFRQWLPFVQSDGEGGVAPGVQSSLASANGIIQRSAAGQWGVLGSGAAGGVFALVRGPDGTLYAGGSFTSMGGVANTRGIAKWNGSAWSALGTGADVSVMALAFGPDGTLYAAGDFGVMGGVANTNHIAKWNGSAWSAMGTGAIGGSVAAYAITVDSTGNVYVGGDFSQMGGVANTARIAKWNGSAWSALGTGANGIVRTLVWGGGILYAGGQFTLMGGVADTVRIAKWNGSAWSAMGAGGATSNVYSMVIGLTGIVYAAGDFTTIGAVSANRVAAWNGTGWSALGTGVNGTAFALSINPLGQLLAIGAFTTAGSITFPNPIALWNGGAWVPFDAIAPGTPNMSAIYAASDGTVTIGFDTSGTATVATLTTATNTGTAKTYPSLTIKGPSSGSSRIYQIVNYTTSRAIYLNYTINTGETARMTLDPSNLSFTSDFQGNLINTIMPGSTFADFFLQPGVNNISMFGDNNTVVATMAWRVNYNSVADLQP